MFSAWFLSTSTALVLSPHTDFSSAPQKVVKDLDYGVVPPPLRDSLNRMSVGFDDFFEECIMIE